MTYISTLPTPPSRSDDPTGFSAKADALLAALPDFVTEANALSDEVDAMRDDAETKRAATETLRDETTTLKDAAEDARDAALSYRDTANTYRGQAETARDQAQTAAAAAGAAAGLPSLSGNAGKQLVVSSGEGGVEWANAIRRLPIFSPEAAGLNPVSGGEVVGVGGGTGVTIAHVVATDSMFIMEDNTSNNYVYTSPDGFTWTYRTFTSFSAIGRLAASPDGACVIVPGAASALTRRSTNHGVTWSDGGNLPANSYSTVKQPAYANGVFLVKTGAADTNAAARSTDGGQTWTATTLPLNSDDFTSIGGLFCIGTSTYYYTSPDGINWTLRTCPGSTYVKRCGDVLVTQLNPNGAFYSEDGINWESIPGPAVVQYAARINDTWLYHINSDAVTIHNDKAVKRILLGSGYSSIMAQTLLATILAQFNTNGHTVITHNVPDYGYFEG